MIAWAFRAGWHIYHTFDSRRSPAGFPDLVLVRDRVIYAECKTMRGYESPAQKDWRQRLEAAGQECYVWRPNEASTVKAVLGLVA